MAVPPLHVAVLMGRFEIAKLLLSKGAKASVRNKKGESSIDAVSGEWSDGVAGFYGLPQRAYFEQGRPAGNPKGPPAHAQAPEGRTKDQAPPMNESGRKPKKL